MSRCSDLPGSIIFVASDVPSISRLCCTVPPLVTWRPTPLTALIVAGSILNSDKVTPAGALVAVLDASSLLVPISNATTSATTPNTPTATVTNA